MSYIDQINALIESINPQILDFSLERKHNSPPTQASSEFLTNKEQGDWAEKTLLWGINNNSKQYIAVKYGIDNDIVAGEEGFKEFYENYQNELDLIGKRPDLLIFDRKDFPYEETNISHWNLEKLDDIVPKAKCAIEVRSSAFLINKYEAYMNERQNQLIEKAMLLKGKILEHAELLKNKDKKLCNLIESLTPENLHGVRLGSLSDKSDPVIKNLSDILKELKKTITAISQRTFLSITPKAEDLKVVYTWIKRYNVPHFYVQVFFDKAYGISFEKILRLIGTPELKNREYFIERDVKNQNKTTIKINASKEIAILNKISLPEHYSEMTELGRGRLLSYVRFKNSTSSIDYEQFEKLFGFNLK